MNKAEARSFVREIAEEMQKQGDPVFFTEAECARVLMCAFAKENRWISVEEKLPELQTKVMVLFGAINNILLGELYNEKEKLWQVWFSDGALLNIGYNAETITHWRPLPQPPKPHNTTDDFDSAIAKHLRASGDLWPQTPEEISNAIDSLEVTEELPEKFNDPFKIIDAEKPKEPDQYYKPFRHHSMD